MKTLLTVLLLAANAWGFVPSRTQTLANAIARAEGFYVKGSLPNRLHNPGDIRAHRNEHYPGQIGLTRNGYVIFRTNAAGWAALRHQIDKIVTGTSKHYNVNMTLRQLGKRYATSAAWVRNVSRSLGVAQSTELWEVLDVAPQVTVTNVPLNLFCLTSI
jgi:hypothetical protein